MKFFKTTYLAVTFLLFLCSCSSSTPERKFAKQRNFDFPKFRFDLNEAENGISGLLTISAVKLLNQDEAQMFDLEGRYLGEFNIVASNGMVVLSESNEFSSIVIDRIDDSPKWLEIKTDKRTGMGSYNGFTSEFIRVRNGKIEKLRCQNLNTGKEDTVQLMISLKTQWILSNSDSPHIYEIYCRPDFEKSTKEEMKFQMFYCQYFKSNEIWFKTTKIESGFAESPYFSRAGIFEKFK